MNWDNVDSLQKSNCSSYNSLTLSLTLSLSYYLGRSGASMFVLVPAVVTDLSNRPKFSRHIDEFCKPHNL